MAYEIATTQARDAIYAFSRKTPTDFTLATASSLRDTSRMISSLGMRCLFAATLLASVAAQAVTPVTVTWTGLGTNDNWTNGANWQSNTPPPNDGSALAYFGVSARPDVTVDGNQSVNGLKFDFSSYLDDGFYTLRGTTGSLLTLGAGGLTLTSGSAPTLATTGTQTGSLSSVYDSVTFDSSLGVVLGQAQTWSVGYDTSLTVMSVISGSGKLTLTGGGYTTLKGSNTYAGGTVLESADVLVGGPTPFGNATSTVTINGHTSLSSYYGDLTLANPIELNATLLELYGHGLMKLTGTITLGANTTLAPYADLLRIEGAIGQSTTGRMLTFDGYGTTVLSGTNTYTGGTAVYDGAVIFRNSTSVPTTGFLSSDSYGYIGAGFNTDVQGGFIEKFNTAATYGVIGFDTDPSVTAITTFAEPVDLTGFNSSVRLGSATRAILSGEIKPATGSYNFGGGGGTLTISSRLTNASATAPRSVRVDSSWGRELTLKVTNNSTTAPNDYTGITDVNRSAIVFGPEAISTGSADGSFFVGTGGYIGSEEASADALIAKFSPDTTTGVIGFDSASGSRIIAGGNTAAGIDLRRFNQGTTSGRTIALGTSSAATLSGTISLPSTQWDYYFTGYKGGLLTVASTLTNSPHPDSGAARVSAVHIGDSFGDYPNYDPNTPARLSTVILDGANTHTGGTFLHSGVLKIGNATALGTGPLTISYSTRRDGLPRLETTLAGNPVFNNDVIVEDSFEIGGDNAFTLSGKLSHGSGYGFLAKHGAFNLTLTGDNTGYYGGFDIFAGTITFVGSKAAGAGDAWLWLNDAATAAFAASGTTAATPIIGGLESYSPTSRLNLGANTTLTIDQWSFGAFAGVIEGSGALVKAGYDTLRLESANTYTGGTTLEDGTISYAKTGALGTGAVKLDGYHAELLIEPGTKLTNALSFGPLGGRLIGHGEVAGSVSLTAEAGISPGHSHISRVAALHAVTSSSSSDPTMGGSVIGKLTFNSNLTWKGGAYYEVDVQDANGGAGVGFDTVHVNGSLTFDATFDLPFTIYLSSLTSSGASGNVSNFVATNAYSWQIASTTTGILNFNPAAVFVDTSGFMNDLGIGSFNVSLSGNNLMLNFTPVPEPSTWALMIAGVGVVAITALRRRRR